MCREPNAKCRVPDTPLPRATDFFYPRPDLPARLSRNFFVAFSAPLAPRLAHWIVAGRRWVVLAMLLALHAALVSDAGGVFQRLWLLVHFGLFLLWQPFFAAERELDVLSVVLLLAIIAATLYFVSGWMIVMWLLLLMGILGGRVFTLQSSRRNRFYLVAFAYVLVVLLLWVVPEMLVGEGEVGENVESFVHRILPFMLALLIVLPLPGDEGSAQVFDFFYAVLVFQLGVVLALGSMVLSQTTDNYVDAVMLTVLGFGVALIAFGVLWNPMRGFGGLRTYFSAYLMSVGMPFELWMRRVAELAESVPDPHHFLDKALAEIAALPWMRGGRWRSPDGEGVFGELGEHASRFTHHELDLEFHTQIEMSPALFLHMRLLSQVVGEFYEGKRREAALRHHAYLQAVHETGARLTHDMKNLLQSLYALMSMVPREPAAGYSTLLQRQLPELTKRLHSTLEKLRSPEVERSELLLRATTWWMQVDKRLAGSGIALEGGLTADANIPVTLFDSFLENALDNARAKLAREPGISITVRFEFAADRAELSVTDTGSAVPEAIAQRLMREPIERGSGLGIGLFHLARLAGQAGYRLALVENRDGCVRFALQSQPEAASGGEG